MDQKTAQELLACGRPQGMFKSQYLNVDTRRRYLFDVGKTSEEDEDSWAIFAFPRPTSTERRHRGVAHIAHVMSQRTGLWSEQPTIIQRKGPPKEKIWLQVAEPVKCA